VAAGQTAEDIMSRAYANYKRRIRAHKAAAEKEGEDLLVWMQDAAEKGDRAAIQWCRANPLSGY
jgi:hypothetical protein